VYGGDSAISMLEEYTTWGILSNGFEKSITDTELFMFPA
jgi:hypothetical protein